MEKAAAKPPLPHDLILESRSRLTVTGVQRVLHCSAESAALETGKGILHLSGAQISMQTLDLEAGEAKLTGRFDGLEYTAARAAGGFWHCCADGTGSAARPAFAGSCRLCRAGRCPWRGAGVFAGAGQGGFCAGCAAFRCGAAGVPELRRRVQRRRGAAVVHGGGSLCRCPLHCRGAGRPAAGAGAGDRGCFAPAQPYFAPFCGAACAPPPRCGENCPQITPERGKNRKKIQKELAKPAGIVV